MKIKPLLISFLLFLLYSSASLAQKKDSSWVGLAEGVVRDSVHNYVLQSATVAVYKTKDTSLVSYQLANNFGEYHFRELPVGVRLQLIASYKGYKSEARDFIISAKDKKIILKTINLERWEGNMLEEVIVKSTPPVRMNGDTLEFNADAFKLDKNAVVEDLLRKLPGITVWGDGTITVNGREVSSLKVDGKPFMGGDARVATQNLGKDAVDKVQVYQQNKNQNNPLDSITEINVKLKKDKNFGHFGKLAAGYGTGDHYEADANINFFNPKTQLGIVGAANNINKVATDAGMLMRNSTYKGVGANVEYQPDFRLGGLNKPRAGGITFQHTFIDNTDFYNNNILNGNYFVNNNTNTVLSNAKSIRSLGGDSTLTQLDNNRQVSRTTGQSFTSNYNKKKENNTFTSGVSFSASDNKNLNQQESQSLNTDQQLQSTNSVENQNHNTYRDLSFNVGIVHSGSAFSSVYSSQGPKNYEVKYTFSAGDNKTRGDQRTVFTSLADPSQNKTVDRQFDNATNNTRHKLDMKLGNLSPWLLGRKGFLASISTELTNTLEVNTSRENSHIQDWDTATGSYRDNTYLTNNSKYNTVDERPALHFSKGFYHGLTNRYSKNLSIEVNTQGQFYVQNNHSDHDFQIFSRHYLRFIPTASINYTNYQYGAYQDGFNLSFAATSGYPTVSQLYPLVDSSNSYFIALGNDRLKPYDKKEIGFRFDHNSFATRNTFNYGLNASAGNVDNYFANSTVTDSLGRTQQYTVNANGNRYLNVGGNLNKAFMFKYNQLQLRLMSMLGWSRTPNSVNAIWNISQTFNNNSNVSIYYTRKDFLAVELKQDYSYYRSVQKGLENNTFSNGSRTTSLSASVNCTKRLTVGSNVNYNHTTSSGSAAINYTIWNANATYRLLPGNNLELKFAALDLLHQNTSIINYGSNNIISQIRNNVLQQYFMLTVAYYPRQFGKKNKNNKK